MHAHARLRSRGDLASVGRGRGAARTATATFRFTATPPPAPPLHASPVPLPLLSAMLCICSWDERETPDPSGGQLEAVREYLEARPHITRVWIECVDEIARTLRNIAPSAPRMASSASPTAMADASCSSSHSAWSLRTADGLWWLLIATAGRKQPPTPSADTPRSSARGAASAACRSRSRSLTLPTPTCAPTPSARPSS